MACPAVITGDAFVTRVLLHIDCQAEYLGSYGYQSLAQPGSIAATLVSGLLTLFVALWGIRLLLGPQPHARDLVLDTFKIGIVLTLAFSWPAFRTVVHDVVLDGPAEIASSISSPVLAGTGSGFVERLQGADTAIAALTELGTGRSSGQYIDPGGQGGTFSAIALEDESTMGLARLAFLVGMFGVLALLRLGTGLLLAIVPLAAGLLLFDQTRSLFVGWLRGLMLVMLGTVAVTFSLALELAVLEPWFADAMRVRQLGYAIPAAPTELLAMTLAFALVHVAIVWLVSRVTFYSGWIQQIAQAGGFREQDRHVPPLGEQHSAGNGPSRAEMLSGQVETRLRLEQESGSQSRMPSGRAFAPRDEADAPDRSFGAAPLPIAANGPGDNLRRSNPRTFRRGQGM